MLANEMTVLVVEDYQPMLQVMIAWLTKLGFEKTKIEVAENYRDGETKIRQTSFGLIITDVNLPDGNGPELMKLARSLNPEVKLILASGDLEKNLVAHKITLDSVGRFGTMDKGSTDLGIKNFKRILEDQGIQIPSTPGRMFIFL